MVTSSVDLPAVGHAPPRLRKLPKVRIRCIEGAGGQIIALRVTGYDAVVVDTACYANGPVAPHPGNVP